MSGRGLSRLRIAALVGVVVAATFSPISAEPADFTQTERLGLEFAYRYCSGGWEAIEDRVQLHSMRLGASEKLAE